MFSEKRADGPASCPFSKVACTLEQWEALPRYTEAEMVAAKRHAKIHPGCNYYGYVGEVCNKCGRLVRETDDLSAVEDAQIQGVGAAILVLKAQTFSPSKIMAEAKAKGLLPR